MGRQFKPGQLETGSLFNISSSFALTASYLNNYIPPFPFTGSAQITGSLGVTGSINNLRIGNGGGNVASNIAIGTETTLSSSATGANNIAIGGCALRTLSSGYGNAAIGFRALANTTTGKSNTAIGYMALNTNSTGCQNVAIGRYALQHNNGKNNIGIGHVALRYNTTGCNNLAIGYFNLYANTTGRYNVALGISSLRCNTTGCHNTAGGGLWSLRNNTTGCDNIAIGYMALCSNTTANNNTALGRYALRCNTTGANNTAIGSGSLSSNTTGAHNNAIGQNALCSNTTGTDNAAIGYNALRYNTTGCNNIAHGLGAMRCNISGNYNVALGEQALRNITSGSCNVVLGVSAARLNSVSGGITSLSSSIVIGANTKPSASGDTNEIVIGDSAIGLGSNTTVIGNSSTTTARIWGQLTANSFTGSLFGTASNAVQAVSASYLNTLNQDLTFNGNLTLNGTASISYLNVSYESASVIYSSGSNQFGDAANDVQTLYGVVVIPTGSLTVTGSVIATSFTGSLYGTSSFATTASYIQNAQTASYVNPLNQNVILTGSLNIRSTGGQNLFFNNSGQLGSTTTGAHITMTPNANSTFFSQVVTSTNGFNATPGGNSPSQALGVTVGAYPAATLATFSSGSVTALTISGSGMRGTGSFNYTGSITNTGLITAKGSGTSSATTALRVENANGSASLVVLDNGFVGINTGSAQYNLDINGTARVTGDINIGGGAQSGFNNRINGSSYFSGTLRNDGNFTNNGSLTVTGATGVSATFVGGTTVVRDGNKFLVGGNSSNISVDASAIVEIRNTTQGFLPPRTNTTASISTPAQGLITYLTGSTNEGLYYYNSGSYQGWTRLLNDSGSQILSGSLTTTGNISAGGNVNLNGGTLSFNTNYFTISNGGAFNRSGGTITLVTDSNTALTVYSNANNNVVQVNTSLGIGKIPTAKLDITGSALITGSLNVTSGITGSLFGTSSFAVTASYIDGGTF